MKEASNRVQTAQYYKRQKHQMALMKQIKSLYTLNNPKTTHFKSCHTAGQSESRLLKKKRNTAHEKVTLYDQIREIEKIRGKKKKPMFSFEQDQKKICANGWLQFGEKVDRSMQTSLNRARDRARNLKKRATVSTVFLREGLKPADAQASLLGNQKIRDIMQLSKGGEPNEQKYCKIADLTKAMKHSIVFRNAYQACLHSKSYTQTLKDDMKGQQLKSFVYLNENRHKLPQKKMHELMKNNYFMA